MLQYIGAYVKSHHNIFFISEKLIIDWLITYICHIGIEKNIFYLYELQKQAEKLVFCELFCSVSQRVQMNYIFSDNAHILCLSCNVQMPKTIAKQSKMSKNKRHTHHFRWCSLLSLHLYQYCNFFNSCSTSTS